MKPEVLEPMGRDLPDDSLRLLVCDRNRDAALALARSFAGVGPVEVRAGDLLRLRADALVSPANSFGDMDGGIDAAIDAHYGGRAQTAVKRAIAADCLGELPVGHALVVPMDDRRFGTLIVAPTMRVPGCVAGSIHAYLAMRAVLVAVTRRNRLDPGGPGSIRSVALPALGAGVGRMALDDVAHQMRAAYDNVVGAGWRAVVHSSLAPLATRGC